LKLKLPLLFTLVACCSLPSLKSKAQPDTYILNGSATKDNCNCYTLTPAVNTQSGSVWNANKINLNNKFDFAFNVFLGCQDGNGADGMVFILQPISTSVGSTGQGMGFAGITPSIGIALDTWQNNDINDPAFDHISIQANGVINHSNDLAGPVQISTASPNVEDCQWHVLRITWDPATQWLRAYFDGTLRVEKQVNLISTIFNNDPMVFWGFSAATGGFNNRQQFCTALNPSFSTNFNNDAACIGSSITFDNKSISFTDATYYWNFGNNTESDLKNPPPVLYALPGEYEVKLVVKGFDGCISDTLRKIITVGDIPVANFDVFDTCSNISPRVNDRSLADIGTINSWTWTLDGSTVVNGLPPVLPSINPGPHQLQLIVNSSPGCTSAPISKSFTALPIPIVKIEGDNGVCLNEPIDLLGTQIDNVTTITQWNWVIDINQNATQQNTTVRFTTAGEKSIKLIAKDDKGCISKEVNKVVTINTITAHAGEDTLALRNVPFRLNGRYTQIGNGPVQVSWSPPFDLDDPSKINATALLTDDQEFRLQITTAEGCTDDDVVKISVFKGSAVYVPSGFSPNNDGLNDILKPLLIGIKKLEYFNVYNRWGELIFTTQKPGEGWRGDVKGLLQETGTFVWTIKAIDIVDKVYQLKGTTTLIR
jgi:gliding motility-associated-like protein